MRRRMFDESGLDPGWLTYGDRVQMNAFGLERHPTYGGRQGVIVGMGTRNSLRVKFDDRVTVQAIHRDYLERALVKSIAGKSGAGSGEHER